MTTALARRRAATAPGTGDRRAAPVIRAIEWDGTARDDPSEDQLHDPLADLIPTWRFVIVERLDREPAGHHCAQVCLHDGLSHQVEYRESGPDRHVPARREALTWVR
ncbi:hypothetical protein [Streptomyces sp. NPDC046870]|uniref:hypothetical protein n=1 Tax=Streptomyces sp. NPDC046870 TaxID=3155135 RepID=UPI0034548309